LIRKLNTEYKDLLPNLIDEKDSVDDIAKAQKEMNKQMAKKIAMIAAQDEMSQATKDAVDAQKLYNETLKVGDDLAQKSQASFGRVLSSQDIENYKESLQSLTTEKAALVQEIDFNNQMLSVNKKKLDEANQAVIVVAESVDALAESMSTATNETGGLSDETDDLNESLTELADIDYDGMSDSFHELEENLNNTSEAADEFDHSFRKAHDRAKMLSAVIIETSRAFSEVFATSIREAFGELEEGETRFGKFKESMGKMLTDLVVQFLAAAAAAFLLAVAIRFAIGAVGPGGFDIASGLKSIGGMKDIFGTMQGVGFMSSIPMLAEGGVVTSPTLAMIGEGGQSEAVIPLDRLNEFGGGSQRVEVVGRISGADILLSNERASRNRTRQRGF